MLIILIPSLHFGVRIDNILDIFSYIIFSPSLVVKWNLECYQWIKDHSDIHLWLTGPRKCTFENWEFQIDRFFNQFQNLLMSRQHSHQIRAFIESIETNINWALLWQIKHAIHTFFKRGQYQAPSCHSCCLNIAGRGCCNMNLIQQKAVKQGKIASYDRFAKSKSRRWTVAVLLCIVLFSTQPPWPLSWALTCLWCWSPHQPIVHLFQERESGKGV